MRARHSHLNNGLVLRKINQISEELTKLDDVQLDTVIAVINGLQHKVR